MLRAPIPGPPAPPRFLPAYDNLLLSHADRSRFHSERERLGSVRTPVHGTVLHDGVVCAVWRIAHERDRTTLEIEFVTRLTKRAAAAIEAEGRRYVRFVNSDSDPADVRVVVVWGQARIGVRGTSRLSFAAAWR